MKNNSPENQEQESNPTSTSSSATEALTAASDLSGAQIEDSEEWLTDDEDQEEKSPKHPKASGHQERHSHLLGGAHRAGKKLRHINGAIKNMDNTIKDLQGDLKDLRLAVEKLRMARAEKLSLSSPTAQPEVESIAGQEQKESKQL